VTESETNDPNIEEPTAMGRFISILAVGLTLLAIAWAADLFRLAGLLLYTEQFLSGIIAIAVPLVLMSIRINRERNYNKVPW